tara:strand:- start:4840 stop:6183 length:1344 start_codon:yes stop_codon:yes gene_type:complete
MQNQLKIFLPIETKSRELPYKAPLAFILANQGYRVIVGRQQEIRLTWFKYSKFIYIDKSSARTKYQLFKDIKYCGGNIGVFCEEGLVYRSKSQYLAERIYSGSYNLIDKFWCWGFRQYDDISEKFNKKKLKIIDSPRLSISIKNKKSSKTLVNNNKKIIFLTSFGRLNKKINNKKQTQLEILKKRGTFDKNIGEKFYKDWDNYLIRYQKSFIDLIEKCCKEFPNLDFSIRVHPSESKDKYLSSIKKFNNLSFSEYEELGDSIINASHIISSYSTTSLEAHFINQRSFVYTPIKDSRYEPKIIKKICVCCKSSDEIISKIKTNHKNKELTQELQKYISLKEPDYFKILSNFGKEILRISKNSKNERKYIFSFLIRIKYFLKYYLRNFLYSYGFKKDTQTVISKCKSISKKEIINYGEEFLVDNDEFSNIKLNFEISELSNNVFEIYKS